LRLCGIGVVLGVVIDLNVNNIIAGIGIAMVMAKRPLRTFRHATNFSEERTLVCCAPPSPQSP
jgi:hypothetical protein